MFEQPLQFIVEVVLFLGDPFSHPIPTRGPGFTLQSFLGGGEAAA